MGHHHNDQRMVLRSVQESGKCCMESIHKGACPVVIFQEEKF